MYKGYEAPVDDFAAYPTGLSFTDIAQNRLDAFLDASDNPDLNLLQPLTLQ